MRANWSEEESRLLQKIYPLKTSNELAEIFPQYNNTQILRKAKQLGVKKKKEVSYKSRLENSIIQRNDLWSDNERKLVIEKYETHGARGVKQLLNNTRSEEQIKKMANKLGITRKSTNIIWEQSNVVVSQDRLFSVQITYKGS